MIKPPDIKQNRLEKKKTVKCVLGFDYIPVYNEDGLLVEYKCIEINGVQAGFFSDVLKDSSLHKTDRWALHHKLRLPVPDSVVDTKRSASSIMVRILSRIISDISSNAVELHGLLDSELISPRELLFKLDAFMSSILLAPNDDRENIPMRYYFDIIKPLLESRHFHLFKKPFEGALRYLLMASEFTFTNECSWSMQQITEDKQKQSPYVDVRCLKVGDSLVSNTGYWIIKPRDACQGEEVSIIDNDELETLSLARSNAIERILSNNVLQEYHKTFNGDTSSEKGKLRQSVLRVHLEFEIRPDGHIDIFEDYGYAVGYTQGVLRGRGWKDVDFGTGKVIRTISEVEKAKLIQASLPKIRRMAIDAGELDPKNVDPRLL